MEKRIKGYLQLTRPANLPTAMADIIAGAAVSQTVIQVSGAGSTLLRNLLLLCMASVLLYASGVVFNDFFDRKLDARERPERPIPSGIIRPFEALIFGFSLMLAGVLLAFTAGPLSGFIAFGLACSILCYDAFFKEVPVLGPLNMGVCRGINLLLGMSVLGLPQDWWIALFPVVYIFAITLISKGEVAGNNRYHLVVASLMYLAVILGLGFMWNNGGVSVWVVIPFIAAFSAMIFFPLFRAYIENSPANIRKAVKSGVISLILLDACIAVIHTHWWVGLSIVLLLPLSVVLSQKFAVT